MNNYLVEEINRRMIQYEHQFSIRVLFWALRSSINIGIKRRNSDLDIMFVYLSDEKKLCYGIHDITGHGLDFWGIEIHEILTTIFNNNKLAYQKNGRPVPWHISHQHKRAGCNYYFGIYSTIGSPYYQEQHHFITNTSALFMEMFEKRIAAQQMIEETKSAVDNIIYYEKNYLYDYLYTLWRLELCRHILQGGLPGDNNIDALINKYCTDEIKKQTQYYLNIYKETYQKQSAFFQIDSLNQFIIDEHTHIQELIDNTEYEKKTTYIAAYRKIADILKTLNKRSI